MSKFNIDNKWIVVNEIAKAIGLNIINEFIQLETNQSKTLLSWTEIY